MLKKENLTGYPNKFGTNPLRLFMYREENFTIKDIKLYCKKDDNTARFVKIGNRVQSNGEWKDNSNVSLTKEAMEELKNLCIEDYEASLGNVKVGERTVVSSNLPSSISGMSENEYAAAMEDEPIYVEKVGIYEKQQQNQDLSKLFDDMDLSIKDNK